MRPFGYSSAENLSSALQAGAATGSRYLAGGTNLIDLMKADVEKPAQLVHIGRLPFDAISERDDGGLRLGALVSNAQTAYDPRVADRYPVLTSAILAGASPQIRNAATNGGNLNQRTRCAYFYDPSSACNKRVPGVGCGAVGGATRAHAVLGASESCIATHPSDMCVALAVLDATVQVSGADGERSIPFADYHRLPGAEPWRDTTLPTGALVTAIDLPPPGNFGRHYTYLKMRDRASYAFALVSVAVLLRIERGVIEEARIALGGVAHKPWRVPEAELLLHGAAPSVTLFAAAADRLLQGAVGHGSNSFKIPLSRRAITRACSQAAAGTPQSQSDKRIT